MVSLFYLFFIHYLSVSVTICIYFSNFVPQQIEDKDVLSTSVSRVRPHQDDAYVQVHTFFFFAKKKIFPQYYLVAKKYYFGHVTIAILFYGVTVLFLIMKFINMVISNPLSADSCAEDFFG